jgi:hypothetical protein
MPSTLSTQPTGEKKFQKKLLVKATDEVMKSNTEGESPYEGLRKLTFATTPEQLNILWM